MTTQALRRIGRNGKPVELGRYETAAGESRIVVGRREDGVVRLYDVVGAEGRSYFVEAEFGSKAELAMLVRDYLRQAELLGCCPMSREAARVIAHASLG